MSVLRDTVIFKKQPAKNKDAAFESIMKQAGFFLILFLAGSLSLHADMFTTKAGKLYEGTVLGEDSSQLYLKLESGGSMTLKKTDIQTRDGEPYQIGAARVIKKAAPKVPAVSTPAVSTASKLIDKPGYLVYIPAGIPSTKRVPLILALHPNGSAREMIDHWKPAADKYHWIVTASKKFRNGIDSSIFFPFLMQQINESLASYPADPRKIIVTGFSGGGMGSHMMAFTYPNKIRAIVVNTGSIHNDFLQDKSHYPRGKIAVFLASPDDSLYETMKKNRAFLEKLGWKVKWIEFDGGHMLAPPDTNDEAANWLDLQLKNS